MSDGDHENYWDREPGELTDEDRWDLAELQTLVEIVDRQQDGLEQLAHDDPMGLVWFGDRDEWVDRRLSRKPAK